MPTFFEYISTIPKRDTMALYKFARKWQGLQGRGGRSPEDLVHEAITRSTEGYAWAFAWATEQGIDPVNLGSLSEDERPKTPEHCRVPWNGMHPDTLATDHINFLRSAINSLGGHEYKTLRERLPLGNDEDEAEPNQSFAEQLDEASVRAKTTKRKKEDDDLRFDRYTARASKEMGEPCNPVLEQLIAWEDREIERAYFDRFHEFLGRPPWDAKSNPSLQQVFGCWLELAAEVGFAVGELRGLGTQMTKRLGTSNPTISRRMHDLAFAAFSFISPEELSHDSTE